jgi:hypothetical protein
MCAFLASFVIFSIFHWKITKPTAEEDKKSLSISVNFMLELSQLDL